jgi:tetratricopeptide (TPR) repeat protein
VAKHDTPTLNDAAEAWAAGDAETALAILDGLFDDDGNADVEVLYLTGECLLDLQEPTDAAEVLDRALKADPGNAVIRHARAVAAFELADLAAARKGFEAAVAAEPELGEAHFYLGLLAERAGDRTAAAQLFAQGVALDPDDLQTPVDWSNEQVRAALIEALAEVPDPFGGWLRSLDVAIEDLPADADLQGAEGPISPLVHCLVGGERHAATGDDVADWLEPRPDSARLFRLNLGKSATTEEELQQELLEALLWESMEFLGIDDEQLVALGIVAD